MMSRYYPRVRIEPRDLDPPGTRTVLADLGTLVTLTLSPSRAAHRLLDALHQPPGKRPVERLRCWIDEEIRRRNLRGAALVSLLPDEPPEDDSPVPAAVPLENLALALILVSKSSEHVFVAGKTPMLDTATLCRKVVTRDHRFASVLPDPGPPPGGKR